MKANPLALALILACAAGASQAGNLHLIVGGSQFEVAAPDGYAAVKITLADPNGGIHERRFGAEQGGRIDLGLGMPVDGAWRYSLVFEGRPATVEPGAAESADGRRGAARKAWPVMSGSFGLRGGSLLRADVVERVGDIRPAKGLAKDQVILDDLIVDGSACIGLDCVDGEVFGFDTLRLKENNTRINFTDTSSTASFPSDDWTIFVNDSTNGGLNRLSIQNVTAATTPFTVLGGAPTDSMWINNSGNLGLGTSTPVVEIHSRDGDSPTLRLEQDGSSGWTPQTWDVAGNEANFFIRDVTNGARLSFRIRPNAPTSSIDVAANGNVGFGGANALARIETFMNAPAATPELALRVRNSNADFAAAVQDRFAVDSNGNVTARGTISQLSSRATKENFERLDGPLLLAKLEKLDVPAWNYRESTAAERHIGPVAEEFHDTFGVGADPRFLAPGDVAGVALASVKALQDEVRQRDARISELEARLQRLEALLAEPR
jgi:hypothetical protein